MLGDEANLDYDDNPTGPISASLAEPVSAASSAGPVPGEADEATAGAPGSVMRWVLGAHWLGRFRTPLAVRVWRYGAGSVLAYVTSVVVLFICLKWLHLGAITSTVVAFLAGAIPNWILNRRWAWQKKSRDGFAKETILYVIVSVVALVVSSAADKVTAAATTGMSSTARSLIVTVVYMFVTVLLTGLKYVAYDRLVFVDRSSAAPATRSR